MEWCFSLNIPHLCCSKSKLLHKLSTGHGQWLADQEPVFPLGAVLELHSDPLGASFHLEETADTSRIDCPLLFAACASLERSRQGFISVGVESDTLAELRRICSSCDISNPHIHRQKNMKQGVGLTHRPVNS